MVDTRIRADQHADALTIYGRAGGRVWTLVVACMGVSLVVASMVALNTAVGDIAVATSATQSQLNWMVDGYTVVLACLLLPAGAIGDRYGRRGALFAGLLIFSIASIAPLVFGSPVQIIAARAVAGGGAALVMPATLSLLTVAYPKQQRLKAVGIWAGVAGSGGIVGMFGTGLLLHFWSWQSIFWALGASGLVIFVLACTVSSSRDADAPRVDWLGAVLVGAAVAVAVYAILEAPSRGWSNSVVWGGLAAGLVVAVVFSVIELRRSQPLLDVRLFADPAFAIGVGAIVILFGATFGFFYLGMQYLQLILGYTPLMTAVAFGPFMVPVAGLSALSFWYVPRLGLRVVLLVGMLVTSVGFVCMRGLGAHSTYVDVAWPALVLSAGIGLCTAPTTSAIMAAAPDHKQGVASAVNDTTREVGAALGIAVAGSILAGRYTQQLTPRLAAFPEPVRAPASHSLPQALEISKTLGAQGYQLAELSQTAFLQAMDSSLLVMALIVAVAAVLIGLWAPGRDGHQLRLVRRFRSI